MGDVILHDVSSYALSQAFILKIEVFLATFFIWHFLFLSFGSAMFDCGILSTAWGNNSLKVVKLILDFAHNNIVVITLVLRKIVFQVFFFASRINVWFFYMNRMQMNSCLLSYLHLINQGKHKNHLRSCREKFWQAILRWFLLCQCGAN